METATNTAAQLSAPACALFNRLRKGKFLTYRRVPAAAHELVKAGRARLSPHHNGETKLDIPPEKGSLAALAELFHMETIERGSAEEIAHSNYSCAIDEIGSGRDFEEAMGCWFDNAIETAEETGKDTGDTSGAFHAMISAWHPEAPHP